MSKVSKTKAKKKRHDQKRARKAAQQALYESYKAQGINTKSKRSRKSFKSKAKGVSTISHPYGKCGNNGCIKCSGVYMKPFLKSKKPYQMPGWMYRLWNVWGDTIKGDMLLREEKRLA